MHFKCMFTSSTDPQQAFEVIEMHGREQLDDVFAFRLTLRTAAKGFTPEKFLGARASLTFGYDGPDRRMARKYGLISSISSRFQRSGQVYLECVLAPRLSLLALSHNFRTFIDTTPDNALEKFFQDCNYPKDAYEFRLRAETPRYPYYSQYDESDLHFFKRRLEQQGWAFYFEFADNSDKVVITDQPGGRNDWTEGAKPVLDFVPPGHDNGSNGRQAQRFARKLQAVPHQVRVKDWSYEHPDLRIESEAAVQGVGFGETYLFGGGPWAMESVEGRARRMAEKWGAASDHYLGGSDFPLLLPGQQCSLRRHPESGFNTDYLPVYVEHTARLAVEGVEHPHAPGYSNRFMAIRADRTYRPLQTTPEPVVAGGLHGFVESENADYAQLDAQGRYKVKMGYDAAQRNPCNSSSPLRLLSPHAGPNCGLHFPLRKGTEVLLGHENGNPDRPVILGALPNAEALGPVTDRNASVAGMRTPGDNELGFEDASGAPRIRLRSGAVSLRMGALYPLSQTESKEPGPQEPGGEPEKDPQDTSGKHPNKAAEIAEEVYQGLELNLPTGNLAVTAFGKQDICLGTKASLAVGAVSTNTAFFSQSVTLGDQLAVFLGGQDSIMLKSTLATVTKETIGANGRKRIKKASKLVKASVKHTVLYTEHHFTHARKIVDETKKMGAEADETFEKYIRVVDKLNALYGAVDEQGDEAEEAYENGLDVGNQRNVQADEKKTIVDVLNDIFDKKKEEIKEESSEQRGNALIVVEESDSDDDEINEIAGAHLS